MRRSEEREVKLGAPPSFQLPNFDDLDDGVVPVAHEPQRLQNLYLDTDELTLTRWGVSLRYRQGEGWTLKLPSEGTGDLLVRTELTFEGDSRRPPAEVTELVRAYVRTAPLGPQVRLRTLRRRLDLHDADDVVVRLFDDEVSVLDGRRIAARFRELEAETTGATPDGLLVTIVDLLRSNGAGEPDPTPKVVRALGQRAQEPPEVEVAKLGSDPTAGEVVQRAIAASVTRLLRHDVVVRLDTDAEGVHQARVATRRLRSDLRTFALLVSAEWAGGLRDELGWLAHALGRVRDGDVMLGRMRTRTASLPEASAHGATRVLAAIERERNVAFEELQEAMRGDRYLSLLDLLVAAAREPSLVGDAELPAKDVLPRLVRRPWKSLVQTVKAIGVEPGDDELHGIRIRTKRCRYAAEAVAPVLGKRARAFASDAAELQQVLGDYNDAVVAESWLRDWTTRARSREAVFAAGELAGLERAAGDVATAGWRKAWKRLASRGLTLQ